MVVRIEGIIIIVGLFVRVGKKEEEERKDDIIVPRP